MEFDKAYFDAGLERRGTDCMKWDGMMEEHRDPDMVPMWVADMDFPSAPAIREAVQKVVDQGTAKRMRARCATTGSAATGSALNRRTC